MLQPAKRTLCAGAGPSLPAQCAFHFNTLLEGGDAVSLERLSSSTELHQRRTAARRHAVSQSDREKASTLYGSQPETRLRVVTITGDGRCLFRALVRGCPLHWDSCWHALLCWTVSLLPAMPCTSRPGGCCQKAQVAADKERRSMLISACDEGQGVLGYRGCCALPHRRRAWRTARGASWAVLRRRRTLTSCGARLPTRCAGGRSG
jgi:hypothetical protein